MSRFNTVKVRLVISLMKNPDLDTSLFINAHRRVCPSRDEHLVVYRHQLIREARECSFSTTSLI